MSTETTGSTPVEIKISDVIAMLNAGKTRKEIGAHYGLNRANWMRLFQDPSLKGLKTKTGVVFTLAHDMETPNDKKAKKEAKVEGEVSAPAGTPTETPAPKVAPAVAGQEDW